MKGMRDLALVRREADDAAHQNPPMVGVDERRMQVRAYNAWSGLLGDRQWPRIADLDLDGLDFADRAVLLDFTAGVDNPAIVHLGQSLRDEGDVPYPIIRWDDVPRGSLISRLSDHYVQIFANQSPIGFEAEFINGQGHEILYRGILLPFSSDDVSIDFVLGVINWKCGAPVKLEYQPQELAEMPEPNTRLAAPNDASSSPSPSNVSPIWADGPSRPSGDSSDVSHALDMAAHGLQGRLADARIFADQARDTDDRSRSALYRAIGKAWDFALLAQESPVMLDKLLRESGIKAQRRAPMTPIVKLVFGADHDKSRVAEYAAVLRYAQEQDVAAGTLGDMIASYDGGLKNLVKHIRTERRAGRAALPDAGEHGADRAEPLREARAAAMIAYDAAAMGDDEFVLLIGRRMADGQVAVVGHAQDDQALMNKALRKARPLLG